MEIVIWLVSSVIFFWVLHEVIRSALNNSAVAIRLKENQELLRLLVLLKQKEMNGAANDGKEEAACPWCELPATEPDLICIMCKLRLQNKQRAAP